MSVSSYLDFCLEGTYNTHIAHDISKFLCGFGAPNNGSLFEIKTQSGCVGLPCVGVVDNFASFVEPVLEQSAQLCNQTVACFKPASWVVGQALPFDETCMDGGFYQIPGQLFPSNLLKNVQSTLGSFVKSLCHQIAEENAAAANQVLIAVGVVLSAIFLGCAVKNGWFAKAYRACFSGASNNAGAYAAVPPVGAAVPVHGFEMGRVENFNNLSDEARNALLAAGFNQLP